MKNILISNYPLRTDIIGSWNYRFARLIESKNNPFDFILAPDFKVDTSARVLFYKTKKNKWFSHRYFTRYQLIYHVAKNYIHILNKLLAEHPGQTLQILVVDDYTLIKALVLYKQQKQINRLKLIYSFHGHLLNADENFINQVDKVLFLTSLGYKETVKHYFSFTPIVEIVGNGVNSNWFYPLDKQSKKKLRLENNLSPDATILTWLANDRPSKGLHVFLEVAKKISILYPDIIFQIIGSNQKIEIKNVISRGSVSLKDVAKYLQLSDFYFHTALVREGFGLTIAEAIKTGNIVLASNLGGIPETVGKYLDSRAFLIDFPNIPDAWVNKFTQVFKNDFPLLSMKDANEFWDYKNWEKRMLKGLNID